MPDSETVQSPFTISWHDCQCLGPRKFAILTRELYSYNKQTQTTPKKDFRYCILVGRAAGYVINFCVISFVSILCQNTIQNTKCYNLLPPILKWVLIILSSLTTTAVINMNTQLKHTIIGLQAISNIFWLYVTSSIMNFSLFRKVPEWEAWKHLSKLMTFECVVRRFSS